MEQPQQLQELIKALESGGYDQPKATYPDYANNLLSLIIDKLEKGDNIIDDEFAKQLLTTIHTMDQVIMNYRDAMNKIKLNTIVEYQGVKND
jgi:hypothetical protein